MASAEHFLAGESPRRSGRRLSLAPRRLPAPRHRARSSLEPEQHRPTDQRAADDGDASPPNNDGHEGRSGRRTHRQPSDQASAVSGEGFDGVSKRYASRPASSTGNRSTSRVGSRTATVNRFPARRWKSSRVAPPLPSSWSAWLQPTARATTPTGRRPTRLARCGFVYRGTQSHAALADRGQPDHIGRVDHSRQLHAGSETDEAFASPECSGRSRSAGGQARGAAGRALGALADLQNHPYGPDGSWTVRYAFRRTCGVVRYRFRARLPAEAGYAFQTGRTKEVSVQVRGPRCS